MATLLAPRYDAIVIELSQAKQVYKVLYLGSCGLNVLRSKYVICHGMLTLFEQL